MMRFCADITAKKKCVYMYVLLISVVSLYVASYYIVARMCTHV